MNYVINPQDSKNIISLIGKNGSLINEEDLSLEDINVSDEESGISTILFETREVD